MEKVDNIKLYFYSLASFIYEPLELHMEPHWNLRDFLSAASQRLEMVPIAIRVFSADG